MSDPKLKITFPDKEDSWALSQNSKYVLTAENVNEIKRVVNGISTEIEGMNMFSDIFRFVRVIVPDLLNQCQYSLEIEMSADASFTDPISVKSSEDAALFLIFDQASGWRRLPETGRASFSGQDSGCAVCAEVKGLIRGADGNAYFGRYAWRNLTTGTVSDWFGFTLGAFDHSWHSDAGDARRRLVVTGDTSVREKETHVYGAHFVGADGAISPADFTLSSSDSDEVSGDSVTFRSSHTQRVTVIRAKATADGAEYSRLP